MDPGYDDEHEFICVVLPHSGGFGVEEEPNSIARQDNERGYSAGAGESR